MVFTCQLGELSPDVMFSGGDVYKALNTVRVAMEDNLCEIARKFTTGEWFWYLRRLPLFFFDVNLDEIQAHAASELAEILAEKFASKELKCQLATSFMI